MHEIKKKIILEELFPLPCILLEQPLREDPLFVRWEKKKERDLQLTNKNFYNHKASQINIYEMTVTNTWKSLYDTHIQRI